MANKKLVFLKQLSTFVEDRSLWVEPNRKYDFRLSPNPPFTIFVEYRLRFDIVKSEINFLLPLHSPFTIFVGTKIGCGSA